MGKSFFTPSF